VPNSRPRRDTVMRGRVHTVHVIGLGLCTESVVGFLSVCFNHSACTPTGVWQ